MGDLRFLYSGPTTLPMRLVAFCVLIALAFTRSDDFEDALPEEAFLPEVIFDMEMTQEVAPIVKGTSPYAGVYAVFYRGRQRSTDMTNDCNGKATQKRIFSENLQFSGVKAKCSQARDAKATMYILNTHGKNKYECLRRSGEANLQGSHYIGPNRFWGTVLYKLKKKIVCGITKKAEVCTTKKGTNFRGPPGNEDVKRVDNTKTLAACSALCTANKLCTYFVYQSIYKRCWLKKNYTHKQVDATCESGMKCVTKAKTASATQPAGGPAYIKSVTSSTIKKDVKKLAKKYFSSKQTLKRVNKTRKVVAHLEGDIDDEEDKPLSYLKKNSQGKNRIFGHAYDQYGRLKSKLKKNGQVRRPGYTPADAYTSPSGHYYLGMSRRRIGAGFGRRRRTYVPKKAVKKAVKKTVINAVKNEAKQKANASPSSSIVDSRESIGRFAGPGMSSALCSTGTVVSGATGSTRCHQLRSAPSNLAKNSRSTSKSRPSTGCMVQALPRQPERLLLHKHPPPRQHQYLLPDPRQQPSLVRELRPPLLNLPSLPNNSSLTPSFRKSLRKQLSGCR